MFRRKRMDATLKTMEEQQNAKRDEVPFLLVAWQSVDHRVVMEVDI